jgi:rod shape-determining protein MreD
MRNTAFFIAGVVLLLLQSNLFRLFNLVLHLVGWVVRAKTDITVAGLVPSLVLPLILFMGVHEYSLVRGAGVAFALGYLTDLIGIAPIGLYTSTYVAIFILARAAGVRLAAQTMLMQVGLALAFTLVHSVMILILLAIFGRDAYVPRALYPLTLAHVLATGAVAPLVFRLSDRIHAATTTGAPKEAMPRSRG